MHSHFVSSFGTNIIHKPLDSNVYFVYSNTVAGLNGHDKPNTICSISNAIELWLSIYLLNITG